MQATSFRQSTTVRLLCSPWHIANDFRKGLVSEGHQARSETYSALRNLYILTHGRSRRLLKGLYGRLRPVQPDVTLVGGHVLDELRQEGLVHLPAFLDADTTARL